jgi:hypothetical protein
MAAVVVLAAYAYWLRPALSAWSGADGNDKARALANPGVLLALGFRHLAAHDAQSLVRLGWFVTPLGLVLGLLGLLAVLPALAAAVSLSVLLGLTVSLFYLYKVRVWNDYPFALRRFVPVTLPLLVALRGLPAGPSGRARRPAPRAGRDPRRGPGHSVREGHRAHRRYVDWRGAVGFVADVARRFGPGDVVVFEQPKSIHLVSLPLWAAHGVNALELARFNPDPERLRHLVSAWRGRWRNVYFVHTYRTDLCGLFLERVETKDFGTFEWYAYDRKPDAPEFRSLHFTVSRVVPPEELRVPSLDEVDVGGSDDVQVSGFFDKKAAKGGRSDGRDRVRRCICRRRGRARHWPLRSRRSGVRPRRRLPFRLSLRPVPRSFHRPVHLVRARLCPAFPLCPPVLRSSVSTFHPGVRATSSQVRKTPGTWASWSTASA